MLLLLFILNIFATNIAFCKVNVYFYNNFKNLSQSPFELTSLNDYSILKNYYCINYNVTENNVKVTKQCTTYVIVHGFLSSAAEDWVQEMKNKLISTNHNNVLVVDWSEGASWSLNLNLGYVKAIKEIDYTVTIMKNVIDKLIDNRYILAQSGLINVHCIGHSLGAHACGFLGKRFIKNNNIKIWRISV